MSEFGKDSDTKEQFQKFASGKLMELDPADKKNWSKGKPWYTPEAFDKEWEGFDPGHADIASIYWEAKRPGGTRMPDSWNG